MMLSEPKKKSNVKILQTQAFPINLCKNNDWTVYTAYLTDFGSCIPDSEEMKAVNSMGFFGKGSLSRSYPTFGKIRKNAPPVIKNRQWTQREQWLEEVKELSDESCEEIETNINWKELQMGHSCEKDDDSLMEINSQESIVIINNSETTNNDQKTEEIVVDSTDSNDSNDIKELQSPHDEKDQPNNSTDDLDLEEKLLVLPDSDSDTEDYLKTIRPQIKATNFPIKETLHLTSEESFFLLFGLGCLRIVNFDGSLLNINDTWHYFCKIEENFIEKYVVYHYFRSKGWVVKPGLKYGGDFLLYKQGPPFYHASYIVIIDTLDSDTYTRNPSLPSLKMTWNNLFGLERLSETAAKEILFAQVLWPSSIPRSNCFESPEVLSNFLVKELLWRRWNPKQTREEQGPSS
ncbi:tRNA-splicing endonuclease subunit Sen2 [Prorops nasuta]|uniref:tRNA-splicing endonuclease subunit Sen2 n=1 Tax=Prorops nasuta TaxID=863751 RepID=UPI0034CD5672